MYFNKNILNKNLFLDINKVRNKDIKTVLKKYEYNYNY